MRSLTALTLCVGLSGLTLKADSLAKAAFVRGSELYVADSPASKPRQLTHDGKRKSLPVWSPSGDRVAYITDGQDAFAVIGIAPVAGGDAREIPFRTPKPGVVITGMRYVEELQWIDDHRIALSGSLNPSTGEYVVIDVNTGKEELDFGADGFSLAVSPNGLHLAYYGWVPHFQAPEERRPQLCADRGCDGPNTAKWISFPGPQRHVEFVAPPRWSPDGAIVAVLAQDFKTSQLSLVMRDLSGKSKEYALPTGSPGESLLGYNLAGETTYRIAWSGETVYVRADDTYWKLPPARTALLSAAEDEFHSAADKPREARARDRAKFEAIGILNPDLWCESCAYRSLPRRNGPLERIQLDDFVSQTGP